MANGTGGSTSATVGLSRPTMIVAIVILVGFAALLYYLFRISPNASETVWNRSIFLYGGAEALAFTAAGFIFGKEVHRHQAENAEKRADHKTQQAEAFMEQAAATRAKGEALKKAVALKVAPVVQRGESFAALGLGGPEFIQHLAKSDLEELDKLARELFPD